MKKKCLPKWIDYDMLFIIIIIIIMNANGDKDRRAEINNWSNNGIARALSDSVLFL